MMRSLAFAAALVAAQASPQWCVSEKDIPAALDSYRGTYKDFSLYMGESVPGCSPIAAHVNGNDGLWLLQFAHPERKAELLSAISQDASLKLVYSSEKSIVVEGGVELTATLKIDACGSEVGMDVIPFPADVVKKPKAPSPELLARGQAYNPQIQSIVNTVSQARIVASIHYLQQFETRNSYSPELYQSLTWVEDQYKNMNFSTDRISFRADMAPNVVATKLGVTNPEKVIVIGAHLDSRSTNTNSPTQRAPGADDNASGTVALLELARLIFENDLRFDYTLKFCAFTGEEQGLLGSAAIAALWAQQGMDIEVMFNADMLGYTLPNQPVTVGFKDRSVSLVLTEAVRALIPQYVQGLATAYSSSCCSDYLSFYNQGFTAVGFFENGGAAANYPHYHTSTDLEMYLNTEQLRMHTQAMVATVLTYSGLLPQAKATGALPRKTLIHRPPVVEIMPKGLTYVYVVPSTDIAGSAIVPGTNVSVVALFDKTLALEGWSLMNIDPVKPKYLVRSKHDDDRLNLKAAYGKDLVALTEEYYVLATNEVGERKAHSCGNLMLVPQTKVEKKKAVEPLVVNKQRAQEVKSDLMAKVTSAGSETVLRGLSGADSVRVNGRELTIFTRYSFSPNNLDAAEWVAEWYLANAACDDIIFQSFSFNNNVTRNVVCVKYGVVRPQEIVVVGAHFDSISSANGGDSTTFAPGAVDNGSGSTSVMLIAQALRDYTPSRTIHFVLFSGEEQGLYGSTHYVAVAQQQNLNIRAALIMDMTAYSNRYFGVTFEGTRATDIVLLMENGVQNLEYLKATLGSQMSFGLAYTSFGSDHVPFQRAGIPAILLIERDDTNYPGYHRTTDTVAYCNWDQMRDIARVILGQVVDYTA